MAITFLFGAILAPLVSYLWQNYMPMSRCTQLVFCTFVSRMKYLIRITT